MTARKFVIAAVAALTLGSAAQATTISGTTPLTGPQPAAEMSWGSGGWWECALGWCVPQQ